MGNVRNTTTWAIPITTPNSRHLINKMSFEGCLVEGGTCIFGVRYLHLRGPVPASSGSLPEQLECTSNITKFEGSDLGM